LAGEHGGGRVRVKHVYTNGRLTQIRQFTGDVDGPNLWLLNLLDARGSAVSEAYGKGLWLQSAFDPLTGSLTQRRSGTGGAEANVQQLAYGWDEAGNLASRQDLNQRLTETFGYDANGNLTKRNGKSLTWRSYNLPSLINVTGYSASFSYTPERSRWRQTSPYAAGKEITIYVGGQLEKLSTPVRTSWKHRIPTPSGEVQVIRRSDGTSETLYLASDHLGSVDAVLDATGALLARPSFTAWGGRRSSTWQGAPSQSEWQAIANHTRRGYTGHEQLDNVLLVHMNGRVYDPAVGRFLSADPYVDCAQDMAGWNRYSYVKNRPLSFTDPSGYSTVATRGMSLQGQVRRIEFGPKGGGGASSGAGTSGGDTAPIFTVVTTASRLVWEIDPVFVQLDVDAMLRGLAPRYASSDGAGGQSGGDAAKQREEQHKKCVEQCVESKTPEIYALTAMAGAAPTGNPYAVSAAAAVVYLAGLAKINDQGAIGPGIVATAAGHVAAMFDHRPSAAGVVTGAISAAAGDAIGNHFDGPSGAFWGGATADAVDSMRSAAAALRANRVGAAILRLGTGTLGPAAAALGGYQIANALATVSCEASCAGQ